MAESIRRIEENDFISISAMYNGRKSVEELRWLLSNPENPKNYNAFVAINEQNKIVGEIAYTVSIYTQGDQEIQGVIPMNWKIEQGYKGMAGVLLFKKVLSLGDFGIAISGSETAQNLYPLFKYNFLSYCHEYYKILNIPDYYHSLKKKSPIKTIGMIAFLLPSYFRNTKKKSKDDKISLTRYDGNNFLEEKVSSTVFKKKITKNYIDWLLECPTLKALGFCIKNGDENLGICVLYIQKVGNFNRGRIVHLPYLGTDKEVWENVIARCITIFKKENCCAVNGLAYNNMNQLGFLKSGFIKIKEHRKPVFIKDSTKKMVNFNLDNWFLQYSEGDKAYRDI